MCLDGFWVSDGNAWFVYVCILALAVVCGFRFVYGGAGLAILVGLI